MKKKKKQTRFKICVIVIHKKFYLRQFPVFKYKKQSLEIAPEAVPFVSI